MSEPLMLDDDLSLDDELDLPLGTAQSPEPKAESLELPASSSESSAVAPMALMEVLPADFPLPRLIRFVPDPKLKEAVDAATRYALSIEVSTPDGPTLADVALAALRTSLGAITTHFFEPAQLLDIAHKAVTGKRAEWLADGQAAVKTVGGRIANEQIRRERIAAEERRRVQEEEDRKAREEARKRAAEAEKQKAPAPVVAQMKKDAERATAPPVPAAASAPPKLSGSSVVRTWKARIVGTPADAEPNPEMAELSPAQLAEVMVLFRAVLEGRAPVTAFELNWSVLNARAKSDKSTLSIPGIEAFEDLGTRAKGSRAR